MMEQANRTRDLYGRQTVLFLDEIHRFTKAQQDALLPGVENRQVVLVAATTENPSFSVIAPLLSRSMLVTLVPLADEEVADVLDQRGRRRARAGRRVRPRRRRARAPRPARRRRRPPRPHLPRGRGRGGRRLRRARGGPPGGRSRSPSPTPSRPSPTPPSATTAPATSTTTSPRPHQVDARLRRRRRPALPRPDARGRRGPPVRRPPHRHRRLRGRRDGRPDALQTAVAAMHAVAQIGMPEARIILAQAVVHNALAPKSNAAYTGINEAIADVRAGRGGPVPLHLRGSGYGGRRIARPRPRRSGVRLLPRRAGRRRRAAVPARRPPRRHRLLPAHRPRLRGRLQERWRWLRERLGR